MKNRFPFVPVDVLAFLAGAFTLVVIIFVIRWNIQRPNQGCPVILHTQELGDIDCRLAPDHGGPHVHRNGVIWPNREVGQ